MKINELTNLFVATYDDGNTHFNVLVVALDEAEAHEVAVKYFYESDFCEGFTNSLISMLRHITITEFRNTDTKFDCDYAITYSDEY